MKKMNKKMLLIGAILVIALIGGVIYFEVSSSYEVIDEQIALGAEKDNKKESQTIKAEVKGEVTKPGVYELSDESRLQDLVDAAGGFKDTAYFDNINLSMKLKDEMVLYVYNKNSKKKVTTSSTSKTSSSTSKESTSEECVVPDYDIEPCLQNEESVIVVDSTKEEGSASNSSSEKATSSASGDSKTSASSNETSSIININTAGISELTTLTGIGEAKAKKIIEYRETNGGFKSIEDILNVSGIGEATYEKFKANIKV